jgi:hypothetical protein
MNVAVRFQRSETLAVLVSRTVRGSEKPSSRRLKALNLVEAARCSLRSGRALSRKQNGHLVPDHVIEDLKEVAPSLGFGGYQGLIRAFISNGLSKHLAGREAQRAKNSTIEKSSQRLIAHGVPEQAIEDAVAEMRAVSQVRSWTLHRKR